jgi:hypothetical protein
MEKFLQNLKEFMVSIEKEHSDFPASDFYAVFEQSKDEIKEIINDITKSDYWFKYVQDDKDGYSKGKIVVYVKQSNNDVYPNYYYEFELIYEDRMWGYCNCTPDMPEYNPIHKCCGLNCDWYAPGVLIRRIENSDYLSFHGFEKDLWELRAKWSGNEEDFKRKEIEKQIKSIDEQIAELKKEKELLMKDLK